MDGTGVEFRGPSSWLRLKFKKNNRVRDHRRLSLLVGVRQCAEKFIHNWMLTRSQVGEKRHARHILPKLPARTTMVVADPNYDVYEFYDTIEKQGARPVIKPHKNAKRGTLDARGRAVRRWHRRRRTRKKEYGRRVVCESVNFAFKQRLGRRLRTHGVHRQRRELGFRVLAYNANMVHRAILRRKFTGG